MSIVLLSLVMEHFFQVWFLSPSFSFVLIKECLFAVLTILVQVGGMLSEDQLSMAMNMKVAGMHVIRSITTIMIWYILQRRELTRFYQQLKAMQKEAQVSNILDSNSDAIIVVQLPSSKIKAASE